MNTSNERFKEIRKACKKTQEEWGQIVGITREGIASIEAGRRNVTQKHLKALEQYKEKPINVEYISTGKGEPFYKRSRNQEIQAFANDVMEEVDGSFKKRFLIALSKLDESEWEIIANIIDSIKKE